MQVEEKTTALTHSFAEYLSIKTARGPLHVFWEGQLRVGGEECCKGENATKVAKVAKQFFTHNLFFKRFIEAEQHLIRHTLSCEQVPTALFSALWGPSKSCRAHLSLTYAIFCNAVHHNWTTRLY